MPPVDLQLNRRLRALSRRLPVTRSYERRIAELTAEVNSLTDEVHRARADAEARPSTWVPIGHFYSPIPDAEELRTDHDRIFGGDPTEIAGVDLRLDAQWGLLEQLAPLAAGVELASDVHIAANRGERYRADNPGYPPGDARSLRMMLRHHRPARLVELGSGFSSACMLDVRERDLDGRLDLTFIDPYPAQLEELLLDHDRPACTILPSRTQDVDLDVFRQLESGDVLFVDSTHVARTGSDVNHIVFEILPALAPGVLVHVHDVFPGFEYPAPWVHEGRAWTEQYLLRAFLQYNDSFHVHWWPSLLLAAATPEQLDRFAVLPTLQGGAIWLRRAA